MKTEKKIKESNMVSIEMFNFVLGEIYKRLDRLEAVVESLKYKDAEVIDLDNAEELKGVDDSEVVGELTHDEIESIIDMIRYTNNNRLGIVDMGYWNTIISKLFDLLDNRINEKRNKK